VVDRGLSLVEEWIDGNPGAHTTEMVYYTASANANFPSCGKQPEWAGLPCLERHAAQPEAPGLPNLPETTNVYNIWDEPVTTTDTVSGSEKATRTTTLTYDAAGRLETSAVTASVDKAVTPVTTEYNAENGMVAKQSTTTEGKTKTVTTEYNRLGQVAAYTDATGAIASYEYEKEGADRLTKISDAKGNETIAYNTTTGLRSAVTDSAAGTFTATYDQEGRVLTEGYPNGMTAKYAYDPVSEATNLEYVKATHCTTGCTWYTDSVTPSIHGQWLSQASTFSKEAYAYDEAGRLTEVQETPAGQDCTARAYAYDEDGNRTSLTTRSSGSEKCSTEGGTSQIYGYDPADRLDESGVSYDGFGNITDLPAVDAGGTIATSTYYVNDALASLEQNGEKITYNRDPVGRVLEAIASGSSEATVTSHYDASEDSPAWTASSTGTVSRFITGVSGGLAAIQTNSEAPMLQIADLHGDIVATAALSETESKLIPAQETTEYGVPRTTATRKYSWLGAEQRSTETPTGIVAMGERVYVPQLGRYEQTDPQPGGSINAYAYTFDDPINQADTGGDWTYNYEAAQTGANEEGLPETFLGPGAVVPPPADLQAEAAFAAIAPYIGTDPYVGYGIYIAFLWKGFQIHFDKLDSQLLAVGTLAGLASWVSKEVPPPFNHYVIGAFAALSFGTIQYIDKNNCIGALLPWFSPTAIKPEWYRSKKECG